jgi:hypothetical protein
VPWILNELGRSDRIDRGFVEGQGLPARLAQPDVVPDRALWPLRMIQTSPVATPVPDDTGGPALGLVVVSAALKALIEAMDPVAHVFVPLEIARPEGSLSAGERFLFKQGSSVANGIIPERSEVRVDHRKGEISHYSARTLPPRLTWRRSAVAGRHIWADRYLPAVNSVSDALHAQMSARGMTGFLAIGSQTDSGDA